MSRRARNRRLIAAAVSAVFAAALLIPSAAAQAVTPCGQTITVDLKLKNDLIDCPDDGIIIQGSGVTLNLNGHKITSQGAAVGSDGVASPSGHTNVTIKGGGGGRIVGFETGVRIGNGNAVVKGLDIRKSASTGVIVTTAHGSVVTNNEVTGTKAYGIQLNQSHDTEVSDNEITGPHTSPFSNAGIAVSGSDSGIVKSNVIRPGDDGTWGILVSGDSQGARLKKNDVRGLSSYGIQVYDGSDDTLVKGNEVKRNGNQGIFVTNTVGTGTDLIANTANKNGLDGIRVEHTGTSLGDNLALDNGGWGMIATVAVTDLGGNQAAGNVLGQCSGITCTAP